MNKKVTIIDPTCYIFPHREELVASHPSMQGMWRCCRSLLETKENCYLAPILIDDIARNPDMNVMQNLEDVLPNHKKYLFFGKPVFESKIEKQYGNLGCKIYDSIYHRDVLASVTAVYPDWQWVVPIPAVFKDQQAGMLEDLWKWVSKNVDWSSVSNREKIAIEDIRSEKRAEFLSHFEHHWISENGDVIEISNPIYRSGKVQHMPQAIFTPIGVKPALEIV